MKPEILSIHARREILPGWLRAIVTAAILIAAGLSNLRADWNAALGPVPGNQIQWNGVYHQSATNVWMVGKFGNIVNSTDGFASGQSNFFATPVTGETLRAIDFVNGNVGWAVGHRGTILKVTNGNFNSFTAQNSGVSNLIIDVDAHDTNHVWAIATDGTVNDTSPNILRTADGGTTWSNFTFVNSRLSAVHAFDGDNACLVGRGGVVIYGNINGNWLGGNTPTTQDLQSVHFVDANTGWAVGKSGNIIKTTNGGANWVAQTSGTTEPLLSVFFIDANTGWASGANGTILKTLNGGTTWFAQNTGVSQYIWCVGAADANNAHAGGEEALVLRTTDGGGALPDISVTGVSDGGTEDFGSVNLGGAQQFNYTITNTGNATLNISAYNETGAHPDDFLLLIPLDSSLEPGENLVLGISFQPQALGTRTATVHIVSNAPGAKSSFDINVTGTGAPAPVPDISVSVFSTVNDGATFPFGSVDLGGAIGRQFTVRNTGTANLTGLAISKFGTHATDFTVSGLGQTTLTPGQRPTFNVTFEPIAVGNRNASLQIASNVSGAKNPFDINLQGTGSQPPVIATNPPTIIIKGKKRVKTSRPRIKLRVIATDPDGDLFLLKGLRTRQVGALGRRSVARPTIPIKKRRTVARFFAKDAAGNRSRTVKKVIIQKRSSGSGSSGGGSGPRITILRP